MNLLVQVTEKESQQFPLNNCPKRSFVQQVFLEPSGYRIELMKLNTPYHFFLLAFRTHEFSLPRICFTDFKIRRIKCLGKNSHIPFTSSQLLHKHI